MMIWSDQIYNDSGHHIGAFMERDDVVILYVDGEEGGFGQISLDKGDVRRIRNILAAAERRMT